MNEKKPAGIGHVVSDVITLFELQFQLASIDAMNAKGKLVQGIIVGATSLSLVLAAFTTVLFSTAYMIHEHYERTLGSCLLAVSVGGLVIAAIAMWMALRSLRSANAAMSVTKKELSENLHWLKASLTASDDALKSSTRPDPLTPFRTGGSSEPRTDVSFERTSSLFPR